MRPIPPWQRHTKIFAAFEALDAGCELRIVSDHEPRPLREDFERRYARRYVWLQQMLGADRWDVVLRAVAPATVDSKRDFLRRCAIFADVADDTLDRLEAAAIEKTFGRNETVVEQDGESGLFGVVAYGTLAAVVGLPLGREHRLFEALPGDAFGEISGVDGGSAALRFVVSSPSARIVSIPPAELRAALRSDIQLANAMNELCVQRLRIVIDRFSAQTALSTLARVASALLPHAAPLPGLSAASSSLSTTTQAELAVAAGTVTEVVNRSLGVLEEAGAIERDAGRIVKLDREKLHAYAHVP